jgi:hypothetical protein
MGPLGQEERPSALRSNKAFASSPPMRTVLKRSAPEPVFEKTQHSALPSLKAQDPRHE